jgi:hypothetical protein
MTAGSNETNVFAEKTGKFREKCTEMTLKQRLRSEMFGTWWREGEGQ